jgi:hydrogenase maturation protease
VEGRVTDVWHELERPGPEAALVDGVEIRRGTQVRLRPRAGRDAWDALLAGRVAVVERIEEEIEGAVHLVVSLADDPGRELGAAHPGHRFFFAPDEVEAILRPRVLVAGIGNVFLGDDGFGCAVADVLADSPLPEGVEVHDYGVRGLDLAYALGAYDAVVLVDTVHLGDEPGTVAVIEPQLDDAEEAEIETHGMDPARVLRLARELGPLPRRTLVVGCQPLRVVAPDEDEVLVALSEPVRAAIETASTVARSLVEDLLVELEKGGSER